MLILLVYWNSYEKIIGLFVDIYLHIRITKNLTNFDIILKIQSMNKYITTYENFENYGMPVEMIDYLEYKINVIRQLSQYIQSIHIGVEGYKKYGNTGIRIFIKMKSKLKYTFPVMAIPNFSEGKKLTSEQENDNKVITFIENYGTPHKNDYLYESINYIEWFDKALQNYVNMKESFLTNVGESIKNSKINLIIDPSDKKSVIEILSKKDIRLLNDKFI